MLNPASLPIAQPKPPRWILSAGVVFCWVAV
jgi:hypothetical protein